MEILDSLNSLFTSDNEIVNIIKSIVAIAGFLGLILRLIDVFNDYKAKQNLKTDLEILSLLKKGDSDHTLVSNRIRENVISLYAYGSKANSILSSISGLVIFLGFSLWTVNMFEENSGFSPWMILTMFLALIGLSMMTTRTNRVKNEEFFRIQFYQKTDLLIAMGIGVIAVTSGIVMYYSDQEFFWGYFVALVFAIVGFSSVFRHVSFRRIREVQE